MSTKARTDLLTTTEMYHLDQACQLISKAFGGRPPYLVGTAGVGGAASYRDVDVRMMLDDETFAETCPTRERWELLCLSVSAYLSSRTGLPIDFQLQSKSEALARFGGEPRNPLGLVSHGGRVFAGGGDATPEWGAIVKVQVLSLDEVRERSARFHADRAVSPGTLRNDRELAEQAERGTALFFWRDDDWFNWLCPGCGSWHDGQIGDQPVSGWYAPCW